MREGWMDGEKHHLILRHLFSPGSAAGDANTRSCSYSASGLVSSLATSCTRQKHEHHTRERKERERERERERQRQRGAAPMTGRWDKRLCWVWMWHHLQSQKKEET